jgi:VanZ family protein
MNKLKQLLKSTIVLITFSSSLSADNFFQQEDKQKHIVGSMAIGGVATGLARHYGSNKLEAIAIGIASALLVGIAKEAIDGKGYGTKDVNDIYADTIGAVSGSLLSAQFNWKF